MRIAPIKPSKGLLEKIIIRIREEKKQKSARRRFAIFSIGSIASITAFIPAFRAANAAIIESGFVEFFSLLFSDTTIVAAHWKNFGLSLVETIPVTNIIILLTTILMFLWSFKLLTGDMKNLFVSPKLRNI